MEFNQLAMANAEGSDNMLNRVMPKDNIGLAALLKTTEAAWDNGKSIYSRLFHSTSIFYASPSTQRAVFAKMRIDVFFLSPATKH